ncbi:nitrilase-related carbon-nitrogen hydrolase, partial [Actinocorallia lasiicapitis]
MAELRIALAQVDPTVGDLAGNSALVVAWAHKAKEAGAHLVAFPEMMLTGYPIEDLALRKSFVEASQIALAELAGTLAAEGLGDLPVVVGYLDRKTLTVARPGQPAGAPLNAAAWLYGGEIVVRSAKHHLPNYGVFDEARYFVPGDRLPVVRVGGVDVATIICEDLWQDGGPPHATAQAGAGLLLVLNGSPYERSKDDQRLELCSRRAVEAGCALAYVNMVGGQDELVFDGDSIIVGADGELLARAPQFTDHLLLADLTLPEAADRPDGATP